MRDVCILQIAEDKLKYYPIIDIIIESCRGELFDVVFMWQCACLTIIATCIL